MPTEDPSKEAIRFLKLSDLIEIGKTLERK